MLGKLQVATVVSRSAREKRQRHRAGVTHGRKQLPDRPANHTQPDQGRLCGDNFHLGTILGQWRDTRTSRGWINHSGWHFEQVEKQA